jgi:hypothetical protein
MSKCDLCNRPTYHLFVNRSKYVTCKDCRDKEYEKYEKMGIEIEKNYVTKVYTSCKTVVTDY